MQKQKIIIIIGILLAVAAVFMTKTYIDQQRQQVIAEAKEKIAHIEQNLPKSQVKVLVANKDIPKGTIIKADSLNTSIVPEQYLQPQAVSSAERILGMVAILPISKGEQVTLSKLVQPRQLGGLAEGTPVGKRAVTISVDSLSGLGGMIKPGNYVDVIALLPVPVTTADGKQVNQVAVMPLFQNILVLAVGQDTGAVSVSASGKKIQEGERRSESSPLITLALSPQEANLIAFVQEQGKLRLTLRSPADAQVVQSIQAASWDTLFRYMLPQQGAGSQASDTAASDYVEIYRGLNKERIPLAK
ncbi:MAG: Flp pilus assembly protein CpaB [Candidatus Omnitrophota bacterium]|jgi:pilus assembly protein CpaB|nr:Flp pilus assembly protein CpaB [Candidatus Omnitrophota bacterium]MDD5517823.1 Flp pilus assembly protein CpaB [Candidatus Omnitrophota bacterium]